MATIDYNGHTCTEADICEAVKSYVHGWVYSHAVLHGGKTMRDIDYMWSMSVLETEYDYAIVFTDDRTGDKRFIRRWVAHNSRWTVNYLIGGKPGYRLFYNDTVELINDMVTWVIGHLRQALVSE